MEELNLAKVAQQAQSVMASPYNVTSVLLALRLIENKKSVSPVKITSTMTKREVFVENAQPLQIPSATRCTPLSTSIKSLRQ